MQITKAEVVPIVLKLRRPFQMMGQGAPVEIGEVTAVFVRLETRQGQSAWGCTVAHPQLTGETAEAVVHACREAAALSVDLHPMNVEYSLDQITTRVQASPGVLCAFDLAFHDLLGLSAGMPVYRLLGGFRSRIQTSVSLPIAPVDETVDKAEERASQGFRILKIKGGQDPAEDVRRVQAVHHALPNHTLRLDADGCYSIEDALAVARALEGLVEMLEQPTPPADLDGLRQVNENSPVPVLADQSIKDPASALELANRRAAHGMSIKLATCGGLRCARLIDAISRAARMVTMVSCFFEPALLTAAGLSLALSSPNVQYGDLDGSLDVLDDPTRAGFRLEEGWLVASEVPGLGYSVELG